MRVAYATRIPIHGFGENCSSTVSFLDGIFSARVPGSQEGKKEARGKRAREREKKKTFSLVIVLIYARVNIENSIKNNMENESEEILYHEKIEEDLNYKESVNTSIEWYNKGINFLSEEKSSDALSCFEKSIGGCPKEEKELRVRSQNGRGDALYQMGKYSESILAYHAAISLEPSFLTGRTLYNMGQSYAFLELYEDALKCFEQSIGRGLEKDGIELCKTQINRCKLLLREQNKRK